MTLAIMSWVHVCFFVFILTLLFIFHLESVGCTGVLRIQLKDAVITAQRKRKHLNQCKEGNRKLRSR